MAIIRRQLSKIFEPNTKGKLVEPAVRAYRFAPGSPVTLASDRIMTIEQENVIDLISHNEEEGYVALTIVDHLEWDEENEKLLKLQDKINAYLSFVESGQIEKEYPLSKGKNIHIQLNCMHEPNEDGLRFLDLIDPIITGAGFKFEWEVLEIEES